MTEQDSAANADGGGGAVEPPGRRGLAGPELAWLVAALAISAALGVAGLARAFETTYVVQDDARQHIWWMRRFFDPGLFPGDAIADYFDAMAPIGFRTLYAAFAAVGVDPLALSKLLPVVLGVATTYFFFRLALAIVPAEPAAFLAATMATTRLWTQDDVVSGTSRAFFHPIITAFLYYMVVGARWRCLAAMAAMGLFYPQATVLALGILFARTFWGARPWPDRRELGWLLAAAAVAVALVGPFALSTAKYGPVVTLAVARTLPEWLHLFEWWGDPLRTYWLFVTADETGLLPTKRYFSLAPLAALALPVMLRRPSAFPALAGRGPAFAILGQILAASLGLYVLAHLTLFRLYLPSRYTQHTLWVVAFLAAGFALHAWLDALRRRPRPPAFALALAVGSAAAACFLPLATGFLVNGSYVVGQHPGLYEFVARLPKDALIASTSDEADNLPTFARRSVLFSKETYNAFHVGFLRPIRQRALDLIEAQYALEPAAMRAFVRRYGVDFVLLDRDAFTVEYVRSNRTIKLFRLEPQLQHALQGRLPALAYHRGGVAYQDDALVLLDARSF